MPMAPRRENLLICAKLYGLGGKLRDTKIKEALELMDLSASTDVLVKTYSGGMIRRLEIAQSMLNEPAVLFMDEPSIGLDPSARQTVWRHVRSVRERFRTTIFLTTHYMEEADVLCDSVAFMHAGKIARQGTPKDLRAAVGADATLDDVFLQLAGNSPEGGDYADVRSARRAAQSLE
jgi:ABC-2 type transport system ATP-binding protein